MPTHYIEYDTNSQAFFADLRAQLLVPTTDWSRLTPDTILLSTNSATTVNATVLPFAATGTDLTIGSIIMIDNGAVREYRTITAMTSTTITVAAMTYAHASGTAIRWGNEMYKAVTTRGAQMVVDFNDAHLSVLGANLTIGVYESHNGTVAGPKANRYLHWRTGNGAATHPLHVILSFSKEHIYISVEGPRGGELGAVNGVYGSLRQYFFLDDLLPYDAGDVVPVVVAGGSMANDVNGAFTNLSHLVQTSKSLAGTAFWQNGRLATLDFPKGGWSDTLNHQRQRSIDNKYILSPYVLFADDSGMRGRLASFFFSGFNVPDQFEMPIPPMGTKVEYQGRWYKLLPVSKSAAERNCWASFGAAGQAGGSIYMRSPIVAIPCLP